MNNIIEIPGPELKHAITGLGKIIGRSRSLPALQSVRVSRNRAGIVALEGTDLDSTGIYQLEKAQQGPAVELLVPFEKLQKASKQSKGNIGLYADKKDCVIIRTFISNTPIEEKIEVPYMDDFPPTPEVTTEPITLEAGVRTAFDEALECASIDSTRYLLNSVCLDVEDPKAHYIVSTNGRVVFSANSFSFDLKESLVIPTRKFLGWNGWWPEGSAQLAYQPGKKVKKEEQPGWLKFTAGQWTFMTKGFVEKFPNWKQVIPLDKPQTTIVIPEGAVTSMLEVIARIPGDDQFNHDITLNASAPTLVLQGKNRGQTEPTSVPIPQAQVTGKKMIVCMNRDYLARALRFGLTRIEIVDELTPLVFTGQGKRMVVAPLSSDRPARVQKVSSTPASSPATQSTNHMEERTPMPRQTITTAAENHTANETPDSPMKLAMQQIEKIKETIKTVGHDLADVLVTLKTAEKEKKANDREVEAFREKLREIQSVRI